MLHKGKIVLKTYLFCKIFGFLYRNFVSWFIPGRLVYSKHDIMFHLCIILHFIYLFQNSYFRMWCRKAKYCLQKKWTQKHFSEYLHNFLGCFPVNITFTICHFFHQTHPPPSNWLNFSMIPVEAFNFILLLDIFHFLHFLEENFSCFFNGCF